MEPLSAAVERHGFVAFLVVLALMGAARVAELLVARRLTAGARARGEAPQREPIFVVMVILHALPFVLAPLEVIVLDRPFLPGLFAASTLALLLLALLRVWTLRTLGARWNVRIVRPDAIVTSGPYRFVRHPNYAIVIAELFVLPLVHTAWLTMLLLSALNAFVLARRIPAEEEVLSSLPGYAEAMAHKPRFIPRL
jgi:methyltransferase